MTGKLCEGLAPLRFSVLQHPFVSFRALTANGIMPGRIVLIENVPRLPMSAAIDGITLRAKERGIFQVEPVQSPGVTLLDCRTKCGELLSGHGCGESAGKAGAADLR